MVNEYYCAKWRTLRTSEPNHASAEKKICCTRVCPSFEVQELFFFQFSFQIPAMMSASQPVVPPAKTPGNSNQGPATISPLYTEPGEVPLNSTTTPTSMFSISKSPRLIAGGLKERLVNGALSYGIRTRRLTRNRLQNRNGR